MKVLMIGEGMDLGGCETHIYELTRGLMARGVQVVLLCQGGRYARALEGFGVRVIYAPTARRDPLSLIQCATAIRRALREHFDIVHTHTRGMSTLVHSLTKIAHTVTVHLNFPVNPFLRRVCHFGDSTLAVSEDIRAYLSTEYGISEGETILTHNGVDTTHLRGLAPGNHIVHLSRLDRDRSLCAFLLCQVAPFVLRETSERQIHIFGDGNDRERIEAAARCANARLGRLGVVLHGATEDIKSALALGDIFVGVSRALLEAMAAGRASIVAGNEGYGGILTADGLARLERSNFCARGCPKPSHTVLARDLLHLIHNPKAREECAKLCVDTVMHSYRREGMVEDAILAYKRAIEKSMRSLLFVGFYGEGNFGDTIAEEGLRALFPDAKRYFTCRAPRRKRRAMGYVSRLHGALLALRRVRCVVFGGGTLFQNETSTRSLFYYCLIARVASALGREVILLGGGVDEIHGRITQGVAKKALSGFSMLALRTENDIRTASVLGVRSRSFFFPDLIFLKDEILRPKAQKCALLVRWDMVTSEAVAFIGRCRSLAIEVYIISLFPSDDGTGWRKALCEAGARLFTYQESEELFSFLAECIFVVSLRLHGALASLLSHTPAFLYARGQKQRNLLEQTKKTARAMSLPSPLFPFSSLEDITRARMLSLKKEAVGRTYGFGKIIGFYKECLGEGTLLIQQRQSRSWEPSSCLREQRHQEAPLLPWTSHERPREPHAEPRW